MVAIAFPPEWKTLQPWSVGGRLIQFTNTTTMLKSPANTTYRYWDWGWKLSVNIWPSTNYFFSMTPIAATNFGVMWGDGCESNYNGSGTTFGHYYNNTGLYTVTLGGNVSAIQLGTDSMSKSNLVGVLNKTQGMQNLNSLSNMFLNCNRLTGLPTNMLDGAVGVKDLYQTWQNCYVAMNLPSVNTLTNVTSLRTTWYICSGATNLPDVNALTKCTTLYQTWMSCAGATGFPDVSTLVSVNTLEDTWNNTRSTNYPPVNTLTNVTSLHGTWVGCTSATGFPPVGAMWRVTTLEDAWYGCTTVSNFPDVNTLTNVTILLGAFRNCKTLDFPSISNLTKLTTINAAWYASTLATSFPSVSTLASLTDINFAWGKASVASRFPDVSTLTNVITCSYSWTESRACLEFPDISNLSNRLQNLMGAWYLSTYATNFPAVNMLTNVNNISLAWYGCTGATGLPSVAALIKNTSLNSTYYQCYSITNEFPDVSTHTNVTTMFNCWANNRGYTGDIARMFSNTNAGMPFLTTSVGAFSNCISMTGQGMRFVNMSKSAAYWANTGGPAFVSCAKTFFNCTNLSDYATIPGEYK
jgi:hypothetical protein